MRFMWSIVGWVLGVGLVASGLQAADVPKGGSGQGPAGASSLVQLTDAVVEAVGRDQSSLLVWHGGKGYALAVRPELRAAVGSLSKGDVVTAEYDRDKDTDVLRAVSVKAESVGPGRRALAMALNAAGLVLTSWLLLRSGLPDLIVGADNRYSKSKFQMVVWFAALLVSFITLTALRMSTLEHGMDFVGGVGIPQNLLLLSGLSAATFAVAKGITQGRVEAATRPPPAGTPTTTVAQAGTGATLSIPAATEPGIVQKIAGADRPSLRRDLFRDDAGRVDVGDYQLVILTMLAVVVYLLTVFNFLGSIEYRHAVVLPDVDGAILAAVGVGHGAYLAKKLVGEAGGGKSVAT